MSVMKVQAQNLDRPSCTSENGHVALLNLTTFGEQAGVLHILLKCQFEYWQYFSITKGNHRDPYTNNKSLRMSAPLQIHNTR